MPRGYRPLRHTARVAILRRRCRCRGPGLVNWPQPQRGRYPGQVSEIPWPGISDVVVLALFMLGYILRTTDQVATLSRARPQPAAASGTHPPGAARTTHRSSASQPTPAPRFAACFKIAMNVAMGYVLVMMI